MVNIMMNKLYNKIIFKKYDDYNNHDYFETEYKGSLFIDKKNHNYNYKRYHIKNKFCEYCFKISDIHAEYNEFNAGIFDFKSHRIVKYFVFSTKENHYFNFIIGDEVGDFYFCIYPGLLGEAANKSLEICDFQVNIRLLNENEKNIFEDRNICKFDINDELDKIIYKYTLDEFYPRYKDSRNADILIRKLASSWNDNEKIACIVLGNEENNSEKCSLDIKNFKRNLTESQIENVKFFQCHKINPNSIRRTLYNYNQYDYSQIESGNLNTFDKIYIISNKGSNFVSYWMRSKNITHMLLYNYFESNGLTSLTSSNLEYYDFIFDKSESSNLVNRFLVDPITCEFIEQKKYYEQESNDKNRILYLKKLCFLSVVLKNFIAAEKYFSILIKNNRFNNYKEAFFEIQKLLEIIKSKFNDRKFRDFVLLWVDAVSIDYVKQLKFVYSLRNKSVWFDNLISMNPHTHEVMRTIFCQKKLIDDNSQKIGLIEEQNSILMSFLTQNNYIVRNIGDTYFHKSFLSDRETGQYQASSCRIWETLRCILLEENHPCFTLTHLDQETHEPNLSIKLDDRSMINFEKRLQLCYQDIDEQIEFYFNFFNHNTTIFIFSDHGREEFWPRLHVFASLYKYGVSPKIINSLSTNFDFYYIIKNAIQNDIYDASNILHKYVEIQGNNIRNGSVEALKEYGFPKSGKPCLVKSSFGFRGIVTDEYVYIFFTNSREFLFNRNKNLPAVQWFVKDTDCCDPNLLAYFRELAKINRKEYNNFLETSFFKQLLSIYNLAYRRNIKKINVIRELFIKNNDDIVLILKTDLSIILKLILNDQENKKIQKNIVYKQEDESIKNEIEEFMKKKQYALTVITDTDYYFIKNCKNIDITFYLSQFNYNTYKDLIDFKLNVEDFYDI